MTTHRAPEPAAPSVPSVHPVERAVTAGLVLSVLAGLGWIAGMVYTLLAWRP